MPMGILFWVLFVVALLFVGFGGFGYGVLIGWIPFVLIGLLGWKVFGPVLQ